MIIKDKNYITVDFKINGEPVTVSVAPEKTVLEVIREELGLTGTKNGCDDGNCGACTILMDNEAVKSCSILIGQARGKELVTIEGLSKNGELHPLQQTFIDKFAIQCGYCTPGMIMTALAVLINDPNATEDAIREGMHGNLCRCTGYVKIVEAVEAARDIMNSEV